VQQIPIGPAAKDLTFVWTDAVHTQLHFTYRDNNGVIWDAIPNAATVVRTGVLDGGVLATAGTLK
jgi:hypothetical protein